MKQHLKLLASLPDIDVILAVRSLFSWEGEFNLDGEAGMRTLVDENDQSKREIFLPNSTSAVVTSTMGPDHIEFQANPVELTAPLRTLLSAMGLKGSARVGDSTMTLGSCDSEVIHDRLLTLDNVWILLRRLKEFEPDLDKAQTNAQTILKFALSWHKLCAVIANRDGTPALEREADTLESQAAKFAQWGIAGLKAITLNYDMRGTAIDLTFDGYYAMGICPMQMDWPVGLIETTAPAKADRRSGKYDVRPTKIDIKVQGVLNGLVIDGCQVKIIDRLPKGLYDKVNELLTMLGGQWRTAQQAHIFDEDPSPMIDSLIESGEVFTARDYEFFATTPPLTRMVTDAAKIEPGMLVLEPNGGGGALAMAAAEIVGKSNVTCHELMPANVLTLQKLGFKIDTPKDFLSVKAEAIFDRVIMNPPFSGGRDVAHIRHAMNFLKPGGVLTAIASTQWQTHDTKPARDFQDYVRTLGGKVKQIDSGAFKESGTDVPTTLVVLTKPCVSFEVAKVPVKIVSQELQATLF